MTKRQILHRIRQIANKHLYDTDNLHKVINREQYPEDVLLILDTHQIADEVYQLFKKLGSLPE